MSAHPPLREPQPVTEPGLIRLKSEAFTADALATYGWGSPTAAARDLGVASSTLRRAIARQITPGERLIAALLEATGARFETLFEVIPSNPSTR